MSQRPQQQKRVARNGASSAAGFDASHPEQMAEFSLTWTLQFLYDARTHLICRDFDRDDIAAVQMLFASSKRVLEEATAVPDAECHAA